MQKELNQLFLVQQLRLLFQEPIEWRLVLVVRKIRITSVEQQNFNALRDVCIIFITQKVDQNV